MPATNRTSGSSEVALEFLDRLDRFAATDVSPDAATLRTRLLGWLRAEQAGQASMALIHQLAARALDVATTSVTRGDAPAEARRNLAASCAAERDDLAAERTGVARTAARLVTQRGAWIATVSHSRVVIEALLELAREGRAPRALVAEGRPLLEGRRAAAELAQAGIPVWVVADAALPLLLSQASQVWLGADAVTDRGVINKVGSYAIALAAREHSVPVYALAGRRKFLPARTGALRILEMPPEEIWDSPAAGVQARNVYFELVPLELLRGIVVEDAALATTEAAQLARERALPAEIAEA
jgi:translation initiation factor 2B subunit (eIF-2B alpha/beta/delta family)